jgi:flagellar biosynthesis/type III secretory pathway M-ring protein FliF/YscJ
VLIVIAVLVAVAVFFVAPRLRERRLEGRREEASELRSDAADQARRAEERETVAEEPAERARRERADAEERARRADELDPDVDT